MKRPGMTNTEAIRELEKTVAGIIVRLDNLSRDLGRLEAAQANMLDSLNRVITRLTLLEEKFADLKKAQDESERRRWMIRVAVVGSFLTLVANVIVSSLRN
jgi:hypothetical protein